VETMFWIWMAAAVIFVIIEQLMPTMVFLSFAIAAAISGVYSQFYPKELYWQIGIFIIVTLIIFPLSRKFAKKITKPQPRESNVDAMLGKIAIVTQAIDLHQPGKVRFEGEVWLASADEPIELNVKVTISRVEGTRVHVHKV
jgi:membrane protein implicated in regulation of membrane protease activity